MCLYHVRIEDRGQLPDFICKIFDKDSKGNYPSSELRRSIINNLFVKQADGSFRMDYDNNIIVEARSQIERKEAARNELGMPKTVFLANIFHGNEYLLKRAIDNGEVEVKQDEGKEFYSFRTISTSHIKATESGGEDAVDRGKYKKFCKLKDWCVRIVCMGRLRVFIARNCLHLHVRIFFKCDT